MNVTREQELPAAMAAAGLDLEDVSEVVLTHAHGDHIDGLVHVRGRVLNNEVELRYVAAAVLAPDAPRSAPAAAAGVRTRGRSHSTRARSAHSSAAVALSDDGRIVAVETPGHTPGHVSVICIDDAGRHVMLAGDATDTLEQLHSLRADAVAPNAKVHIATLETILAHCAEHPTVYLPSHDPESAARLAGAVTVG